MMLAHQARNQQIAKRIDGEVTKLQSTGANDLDIFTDMVHQMGDFRILLDAALPSEMDLLCAQYKGFHRYAKIARPLQHIFTPIWSVPYVDLAFRSRIQLIAKPFSMA